MYLTVIHKTPKQNLAMSYGTHIRMLRCMQANAINLSSYGIIPKDQCSSICSIIENAIINLREEYEKEKARIKEREDSSN